MSGGERGAGGFIFESVGPEPMRLQRVVVFPNSEPGRVWESWSHPLGLPLDPLHWRGPGLVPVSQLGEDQFLVAQGGSHYRTNELIGEDGNVVIRLAPVVV